MSSEFLQTARTWAVCWTPMNADLSIDWNGVDRMTDWYIDRGITGLFTCSRSSEVEFLTPSERLALTERVATRAAGRASVIATATFGQGASAAQEAASIKATRDAGADAAIIITNHLGERGLNESEWFDHLKEIVDLTDDIPLGFYECPTPWIRLVPSEILGWAAKTGRFVYHKDVSHDLNEYAKKIKACEGTPLRFYNAQISSMIESRQMGGDGFSGCCAGMFAELTVWLVENGDRDTPETREAQRLLTIAEAVGGTKFPSAAKQLLGYTSPGLDIAPWSRMNGAGPLSEHEMRPLRALSDQIKALDLLALR
ncbi:dihydrodipicolinate synthase family protein [Arthrobacter sp. GMC3]|uniref:dihydrodipicolinate synthase family protein n=1 Tax=Arthrobacter sp. GMC3 TaxID=2058894 RepID=UPI0015E43A13|nr:dihydrodipicolinate synthase family protein [Arthrobacter sp. GMC3]